MFEAEVLVGILDFCIEIGFLGSGCCTATTTATTTAATTTATINLDVLPSLTQSVEGRNTE